MSSLGSLFGGGGSTVNPPKLKTVPTSTASDLVQSTAAKAYSDADTAYASGFTAPLVPARNAMIDQVGAEMGGGISPQAIEGLKTSGLGDVAARIPGKNEFQTAKNLGASGATILQKEQRDRNYASTLLAMNPERGDLSLTPQQVLDVVTGNTGNVNAFNAAIYGTQANQAVTNTLQQGQDVSALASLIGAGAKIAATPPSPYTDPYASLYGGFTGPTLGQDYGFSSGNVDWLSNASGG